MQAVSAPAIERSIARCRVLLAATTIVAVYVDPSTPLISHWIPVVTGSFTMDPRALAILLPFLTMSLAILALPNDVLQQPRLSTFCIWCDVAFGVAIGVFTEGPTGLAGVVFLFAVMEAASTSGLRRALVITVVTVALRSAIILVLSDGVVHAYLMRSLHMAVLGYVIGYLGQQRLNLEEGIRSLAAAVERERVARDLHDDHAQVLAGIGLRLNTCGELLHRGRYSDATRDLAELGDSVNREYDALRSYTRALRGVDATAPPPAEPDAPTRFSVRVQFEGSGTVVDHVLQILREGVRNVVRHAGAATATIGVQTVNDQVRISIDDDGVGFPPSVQHPWSIGSRVTEFGGRMLLSSDERPGAHVAITLPVQ